MYSRIISILFILCFFAGILHAQKSSLQTKDSTRVISDSRKVKAMDSTKIGRADTSKLFRPRHNPNKATLRSAIIPGWGQAYNREYWKIPIVYAALGIPAGLFVYNITWYKRTRDAYNIIINNDTADYGKINPLLVNLSAASLQNYRNEFRQDMDYCALIFIVAWGLNVVDATVFGHLKDFDISDNLSLHAEPTFNISTKTGGLSLVLNLKGPEHKQLAVE